MPAKKSARVPTQLNVDQLEALINKKFGPGTVMRGSDSSLEITRIPTGVLSVDLLLGGGFARGRHSEIYGGYNIAKTYLSFRLIASAQSLGLTCAFLDIEGTFDPAFAAYTGVDLKSLTMPHPESGQLAIDLMDVLIRSQIYDVIVLDSIASLQPKQELEQTMSDGNMGTHQAKLMSQGLRKLTAALRSVKRKPVLLYINQTREKVGVVFGSKAITSGGRAMGFYASTRLEMNRFEIIKRKKKVIDIKKGDITMTDVVSGHRVLLKVEKDKTGGPTNSEQSTFVFDYDLGGIDRVEDVIYCGLKSGHIKKNSTSWWVEGFEDEKKASRNKFKAWLKEDTEWLEQLEEEIRNHEIVPEEEEGEEDPE